MRRLVRVLSCAVVVALLVATPVRSDTPAATSLAPAMFAGGQASGEPQTSPHRSISASVLKPGPWTVVGLGDSVVSGNRCACAPFIDRYGDLVTQATHRKTTVRNLGVAGFTSGDLLAALRPGGDVAERIHGADIVTITIGANDMYPARVEWATDGCSRCFDRAADSVEANLVKILDLIRADVDRDPVEVLVTTYWNVFEEPAQGGTDAKDAAYGAMADLATRRANRAICAAALQQDAECIDLYRPFEHGGVSHSVRLLAADRDHPNAEGHQVIASTLAAFGWGDLRVP